MTAENVTPEEKLLKLIKGKRISSEKAELGARPNFMDKWVTSGKTFFKTRTFKSSLTDNLYRILKFSVIAIVALFFLDLFIITPYSRYRISRIKMPPAITVETEAAAGKKEAQAPKTEPKIEPEKPYSYYSKDIAGKNVFKPMAQQEVKIVEDEFKKIRENLTLTGIIAGDNLEAAIEDKLSQKTHFVHKGEQVGEIVVEDVLENKVILNYRGERFELLL